MSKELIEDLLIEFDEMGFEPTTLCDNQREIDSFRNRLKQVLDYLKAIDNANPSEALECLGRFKNFFIDRARREPNNPFNDKWLENIDTIKQALIKAQEQEKVLEIIKEKPFESASTINYININKNNPKMLDYEHYCMAINALYRVNEKEFDLLKIL